MRKLNIRGRATLKRHGSRLGGIDDLLLQVPRFLCVFSLVSVHSPFWPFWLGSKYLSPGRSGSSFSTSKKKKKKEEEGRRMKKKEVKDIGKGKIEPIS